MLPLVVRVHPAAEAEAEGEDVVEEALPLHLHPQQQLEPDHQVEQFVEAE